MRRINKLMAILLTLALCLSMLPISALADDAAATDTTDEVTEISESSNDAQADFVPSTPLQNEYEDKIDEANGIENKAEMADTDLDKVTSDLAPDPDSGPVLDDFEDIKDKAEVLQNTANDLVAGNKDVEGDVVQEAEATVNAAQGRLDEAVNNQTGEIEKAKDEANTVISGAQNEVDGQNNVINAAVEEANGKITEVNNQVAALREKLNNGQVETITEQEIQKAKDDATEAVRLAGVAQDAVDAAATKLVEAQNAVTEAQKAYDAAVLAAKNAVEEERTAAWKQLTEAQGELDKRVKESKQADLDFEAAKNAFKEVSDAYEAAKKALDDAQTLYNDFEWPEGAPSEITKDTTEEESKAVIDQAGEVLKEKAEALNTAQKNVNEAQEELAAKKNLQDLKTEKDNLGDLESKLNVVEDTKADTEASQGDAAKSAKKLESWEKKEAAGSNWNPNTIEIRVGYYQTARFDFGSYWDRQGSDTPGVANQKMDAFIGSITEYVSKNPNREKDVLDSLTSQFDAYRWYASNSVKDFFTGVESYMKNALEQSLAQKALDDATNKAIEEGKLKLDENQTLEDKLKALNKELEGVDFEQLKVDIENLEATVKDDGNLGKEFKYALEELKKQQETYKRLHDLEALRKAMSDAGQALKAAATAEEAAQIAKNAAKDALDDYKSATKDVLEAQRKLNDAKLTASISEETLAGLKAELDAALANFKTAEVNYTSAKNAAQDAEDDAQAAQENVEQAEKAIQDAKDALTTEPTEPTPNPNPSEPDNPPDVPVPDAPTGGDDGDDDTTADDTTADDTTAEVADTPVPLAETVIEDQAVPLSSGPITRAQFIDYLWRHEGEPASEGVCTFTDVAEDHEYFDALCWADENGVAKAYFDVEGHEDGTFEPDELVTVGAAREFLGYFETVFGTNIVKAADLTTLTGDDGEAVLNCDEVLAEFFGEEYVPAVDESELQVEEEIAA